MVCSLDGSKCNKKFPPPDCDVYPCDNGCEKVILSSYDYPYRISDAKCSMCGAYIEDNGCEEFKAGWRIEYCGCCGLVFNVE